MSDWKVGDIAFQPHHGVVGKIVGFGWVDDMIARAMLGIGFTEVPKTPTMRLDTGDEFIVAGCLHAAPNLQHYSLAVRTGIAHVVKLMLETATGANLAPMGALLVIAGALERAAVQLKTAAKEGSNDHQGSEGLPGSG